MRPVPFRSALVALALSRLLVASLTDQQKPIFRSGVDIVIVDVHVVDKGGQPVEGLAAEDFDVRIDGRSARVDRAWWIGSEAAAARARSSRPGSLLAPLPESSGRLIVLVFQRSMERSRQAGMVKMQRSLERFIGLLAPADRIAVALFDSHLKLGCDFTADRERLASLTRQATVWTTPPKPSAGPYPSLAAVFDDTAASRAGSIEQALTVLGNALSELPGPKSVILFGWGFGQLSGRAELSGSGGVRALEQHIAFDEDYSRARETLVGARASVFSVDVTDAETHSLEAGLQVLSEDTGGFYVRTVDFADAALDKVARILSARYELWVQRPNLPRGKHTIDAKVLHRNVRVFARRTYRD